MSGFYIGVDGKARKVKGAYIGIDGKARKIKKGYIGDENGKARLCFTAIDPVFAKNTWEDVIAACQTNSVPDTWKVGDQKTMTINGTNYAVDIIGKNHDEYSNGSGNAPLTFQLHECRLSSYMNSSDTNEGGWTSSYIRTNVLSNELSRMPSAVSKAIREVKKQTTEGGYSSTIKTTNEKLFLLSEKELFNTNKHSKVAEGKQYEYYANGGSRVKTTNGSKKGWWLRSPYAISTSMFCLAQDGSLQLDQPTYDHGVSYAFCF